MKPIEKVFYTGLAIAIGTYIGGFLPNLDKRHEQVPSTIEIKQAINDGRYEDAQRIIDYDQSRIKDPETLKQLNDLEKSIEEAFK